MISMFSRLQLRINCLQLDIHSISVGAVVLVTAYVSPLSSGKNLRMMFDY